MRGQRGAQTRRINERVEADRAGAPAAGIARTSEDCARLGPCDWFWAFASAAAIVRVVCWTQTGLDGQQAVGDLPIFYWRLPGCGESASTKRRLLVDLRLSGSVAAGRA
jgi:hypothetical protein